jgi:hypothetical protein
MHENLIKKPLQIVDVGFAGFGIRVLQGIARNDSLIKRFGLPTCMNLLKSRHDLVSFQIRLYLAQRRRQA